MGAVPRLQTSPDKVADLERRLAILERTSRLNSASIGSGGLVVRDGGSVTVEAPGDIILEDGNGIVVWRASVDPIKTRGAWEEDNATSIPTSWTVMGFDSVDVPAGFVGESHFLMSVDAGDTMGVGGGNISVQPVLQAVLSDGSLSGWLAGPASNSGSAVAGGAAVATSFWASNFYPGYATPLNVTSLQFGVQAIRAGAENTPTSGNWHVGASIIFKRG